MQNEGIKKNQSLRKALDILDAMTHMESPFRLQDLSSYLSMSPSTVSRFLNTFIDYGYVNRDPSTSFYYLTLKFADIGERVHASFPFQQTLIKYVKEISKQFNESSSLCVENNMQMVYIATEEGQRRLMQNLQRIGHVAPIHATGVGKVHLLNYSEMKLAELVEQRGLPRLTPKTITNLKELKKEIETIRKRGYAFDDEECEVGVRCIAVPIRDYTGKVIAAISLSASTSRMNHELEQQIIGFLLDVEKRASGELGWSVQQKE
ncbi:MAG: IclR family transcriptional regulator [Sphaerochaetaceae bacterium]|jgi:DNA-binding IclR family transcriptional regulator|nr:IclR family transcriptional regulator [Sphaerochaetaceae bacterium]